MGKSSILLTVLLLVSGGFALTLGPLTTDEVKQASQDPVFYNELGYMLSQEGEMEKAQRAFATAVELDPTYETARKNLAVVAFGNEEYLVAIDNWRYLAAEHDTAEYHFDLAQALVAQARFRETDAYAAVAQLEEALVHLDTAGSYPHAAENAEIVRNVLASL